MKVLRDQPTTDMENVEHKLVFSMTKQVPIAVAQDNENSEQSVISCRSYSASLNSIESSDGLKNNLAPLFMSSSHEQSSSSDKLATTSKLEKSGQQDSYSFDLTKKILLLSLTAESGKPSSYAIS